MENILQYLLFPVLVGDTSLTDSLERRLLWKYQLTPHRVYTGHLPLLDRLRHSNHRHTVRGLSDELQTRTLLEVAENADGRIPLLFCDHDFSRQISSADRTRLESVFLFFDENNYEDLFFYLDAVRECDGRYRPLL